MINIAYKVHDFDIISTLNLGHLSFQNKLSLNKYGSILYYLLNANNKDYFQTPIKGFP